MCRILGGATAFSKPLQHGREIAAKPVLGLDKIGVKRRCSCTKRGIGTGVAGRLLRQPQILEHQLGSETWGVVIVGRAGRSDPGAGQ